MAEEICLSFLITSLCPYQGLSSGSLLFLLLALTLWTIIIKIIALWYAATDKRKGWFIALFLINTIGILELIYIFFVRPKYLKSKGKKGNKNGR